MKMPNEEDDINAALNSLGTSWVIRTKKMNDPRTYCHIQWPGYER